MKKVISDEQLAALRRHIMQAERIVICAHVGPDGDAIGSSLAIKHWLARWGKQADVLVPNRFPDFLRWLPGVQDIRTYTKNPSGVKNLIAQADLIVIADLNCSSRLRELEPLVLANPCPKVMFDHHLNPQDFCHTIVSHPEMCATSEVLCHLMEQMGEMDRITLNEATCLYTGMMCDTGAFTYASSRPEVYECIFRLLQRGIDKDRIYRNLDVGNPIIVVVGPGDFTTDGHFLVLTGHSGDKITLNDPNSPTNSAKSWDYDTLAGQIQALWVLRRAG